MADQIGGALGDMSGLSSEDRKMIADCLDIRTLAKSAATRMAQIDNTTSAGKAATAAYLTVSEEAGKMAQRIRWAAEKRKAAMKKHS